MLPCAPGHLSARSGAAPLVIISPFGLIDSADVEPSFACARQTNSVNLAQRLVVSPPSCVFGSTLAVVRTPRRYMGPIPGFSNPVECLPLLHRASASARAGVLIMNFGGVR